jgi:hypothetical protein
LVKGTCGTLSSPARRKLMSYRIAGIDLHNTYIIKMLAVVVTEVEVEGEY